MEGDRLYRVVNFRYFLPPWDPETHSQLRAIKYRDRFVYSLIFMYLADNWYLHVIYPFVDELLAFAITLRIIHVNIWSILVILPTYC